MVIPLSDIFAALTPVPSAWVLPAVFAAMTVTVTSMMERRRRPAVAHPVRRGTPAAAHPGVDLVAELRDAEAEACAEAEAGNVRLEFAIPAGLALPATRDAVRPVLRGLLHNAIRHAPGGKVFVGAMRADGCVRLIVIDDGKARARPIGAELRAPLARLLAGAGAGLVVDHRPGDGTTLVLSLPDPE